MMGFRDRHKGLLLTGAASLVGLLVYDAYRTIKRQEQERQDAKRRSDRYKIGVDPDVFETLESLRSNARYALAQRFESELPPDVPKMDRDEYTGKLKGSGLLNPKPYETADSPYSFNSSQN